MKKLKALVFITVIACALFFSLNAKPASAKSAHVWFKIVADGSRWIFSPCDFWSCPCVDGCFFFHMFEKCGVEFSQDGLT